MKGVDELNCRLETGDTSWFVEDRFGMFIHWGLYALPGRGEWAKTIEEIPDDVYDRYFRHFDPDLYDPDLWAKAASNAGMKYFVITTKHHEGFCLWDSKLTDFKATNTPANCDLLRPMVEAFRTRNMKVGFYHSLIDWHHPSYVIDISHPLRNHPHKEQMNESRRQGVYAEYLHSQVRELLAEFGKIDILWLDFSYPDPDNDPTKGKGRLDWDSENLYKLVRELQPNVILNDRLDLDYGWDLKTPEQFQPREWVKVDGKQVVWEACQTFSGSWGYHRDETTWKSTDQLVQMLIDTVSKGGNLLLNVGPTGRGELDERALDRLNGIGEWMKRHDSSIYGCTQAPDEFKAPLDCRFTYNPEKNRLYLHVFAWPPLGRLHVDGLADKLEYAQLLNDASEVQTGVAGAHMADTLKSSDTVTFQVPINKPNVAVPVIEIFLKK